MADVERAERQVATALATLDSLLEPFDEYKAFSSLSGAIEPKFNHGAKLSAALIAELIAFRVRPVGSASSEWATHFGPAFVETDENGTRQSDPDISLISPEVLSHWRQRISEVNHPVFRARYADLCWVFGKKCSGKKEPISTARVAIDSYLELVGRDLYRHATSGIKYSQRALDLARRIGDKARVKRAVEGMIDLERRIAEDPLMGLWGFSFEELSDGAVTEPDQLAALIADMEGRLSRLTDSSLPDNDIHPHAVEKAALLLESYYTKRKQPHDVKRVVIACGDAFVRAGRSKPAMMAAHWMQSVHELYEKHGFQEEAANLEPRWRELNKAALEELKPFSASASITAEEMQKYVDGIVTNELEASLDRIAISFLPNKAELEETVKKHAKEFVLSSLFSTSLLDQSGRNVAKVGDSQEDLEGQVIRHFMLILQTHMIFLRACLTQIRDNNWFTAERLVTAIQRSPLFPRNRTFILEKALSAAVADDSVTAIHLLIPQIEHAVRVVAEDAGTKLMKARRGGGTNLKTLDELLRDSKVESLLGPNIVFYLRALLTDQRGLNLRNDICHGFAEENVLTLPILERVLHVLFVLSLVRKPDQGRADETPRD